MRGLAVLVGLAMASTVGACFVSIGALVTADAGMNNDAPDRSDGRPPDALQDGPQDHRSEPSVQEATSTSEAHAPADAGCDGATFCDGFERPMADLRGPWDGGQIAEQLDSSLTFAIDAGHASRTSLKCALGASKGAQAFLTKRFPSSRKVSLAYWLNVPTGFPPRLIELMPVSFNYGTRTVSVYVVLNVGTNGGLTFRVQENGPDAGAPMLGSTALLTGWQKVTIDLDLTSTPQRASFTYGGAAVFADVALPYSVPPSSPTLIGGTDYAAQGNAGSFELDDVSIFLTP